REIKSKKRKFVIVCGGGGINKAYNRAAKKITKIKDIDLDLLGIAATRLNAELLRAVFSEHAYEHALDNPTKKLKTAKKIIIGCGWRPGCSTDKDAVLMAKTFGVDMVINLTNVDYIYTKNPKKFKNARKIREIRWDKLIRLMGTKWRPKLDFPFDPSAAKIARKMGLKVVVAKGTDLENLKRIINRKKFKGTLIY
ncbi:MAG: UMP kinase, partial [Candidatus Woesearchaeota archaeon]|nr:UMP kinase [Candidatus Woesearchaeota archaeon]